MAQKPIKRKRPSKKTEALEIRLSPEEKSAFLEACQRAGRTASAVLRDAMRGYSQFGPMARLPGSPIMIASAFLGASAGAYLLVSIVSQPSTEPDPASVHPEFSTHDLNSDNLLTRAEYDFARSDGPELMRSGEPENRRLTPAFATVLANAFAGHDINLPAAMMAPETVSEACWQAAAQWLDQRQIERFERWDDNGDGVVPFAEFSSVYLAEVRSTFDSIDMNGDGGLTRDDISARYEARAAAADSSNPAEAEPSHIATCRADVGPADPTRMRSTTDGSVPVEEVWQITLRSDLNEDGVVSFSEYVHTLHG